MVILLQINKTTFEKSENLEKRNPRNSEPGQKFFRKLFFF